MSKLTDITRQISDRTRLFKDVTGLIGGGSLNIDGISTRSKAEITFAANPSAGQTITINGTAFTFVAAGATGNQINIAATLILTLANMTTVLNASVVAGVTLATYSDDGATKLLIKYDDGGSEGNAFTLSASNATVSSANLIGGLDYGDTNSGGTMAPAVIAGALKFYRLREGTDAESSPDVIRPDDYDGTAHQRVWMLHAIAAGGVPFSDGTEGAPGAAWASDLDTGFYRPGDNTIRMATGGTGRVEWGATGLQLRSDGAIRWSGGVIGAADEVSLHRGAASVLGFMGTANTCPGFKRVTTEIQFRLADDSAFCAFQGLYDRYGTGTPEGAVTAPIGSIFHRIDGSTNTTLYRKESGVGNTGWIAVAASSYSGGDVSGYIRVQGTGSTPGVGEGLELHYSGGIGVIMAYNSVGPVYTPLYIDALNTRFSISGTARAYLDATRFSLHSAQALGWTASTAEGALETAFYRNSAGNWIEIYNGTNAQSWSLYGTRVGASDYERLTIKHGTTAGITFTSEALGAGMVVRNFRFNGGNVGLGVDPTKQLELSGDIQLQNNKYIYLRQAGGTARGVVGSDVTDYIVIGGGAGWAGIRFYPGSGNLMTLLASGALSVNDLALSKTITAVGTTGAQTINKATGRVNFAAAAQTLVVTNSLVDANSIITATVATDDATALNCKAIAAAGSFTLKLNAAATAETAVNFRVTN